MNKTLSDMDAIEAKFNLLGIEKINDYSWNTSKSMITTSLYKTRIYYRGRQYSNADIDQLFKVIIYDLKEHKKRTAPP